MFETYWYKKFKKKGMGQEWTIYGFVNSNKREYNDVFRNYKRPAMSFQVIILN